MKKRSIFFFGFVSLIACSYTQVMGQNRVSNLGKPANCEFNIAVLDAAHTEAGINGLIIVIARKGENETRQALNQRRLHNIRKYLELFNGRKSNTIVTAQGEDVPENGQINLYVKGKHFFSLGVWLNLDIAVGECSYEGEDPCNKDREKQMYPCLDKN